MNEKNPYIIRTALSSYLMIFIPYSLLVLFAIVGRGGNYFSDLNTIFGWIFFIIISPFSIFIILNSLKIFLYDNKIIFKHLFANKEILYSNIESIKLVYKIGPFLSLYDRLSNRNMEISIKPFSKDDVSMLSNVLITNAKSAKIDPSLYNLRSKKFKQVQVETIRAYWWKLLLIVLAPSLLALLVVLIKRFIK